MPQTQDKIVLTGFRATGKSSVGRILAARLNLEFLDTDSVLEKQEGSSIRQMVAEHGWPYFREKERVLLTSLATKQNLVAATGGGAIKHRTEWQRLMCSSLCVWLVASPATIAKRLMADPGSLDQRPSLTGGEIAGEVETVLAEREPLYRLGSHLEIDTTGRTPEEIAAAIAARFKELKN